MKSNFTFSLFLLAAIACLCEGCCPEKFMQVGNRCYYYTSNKKDWRDAHNACRSLDAHLVSIHNAADSEEVFALWKSLVDESLVDVRERTYWIGLNDREDEGIFKWSDDTSVNYSHWSPGEPNNSNGEDCVSPRNYAGNDFDRQEWNDLGCGNEKPYFCRKPLIS